MRNSTLRRRARVLHDILVTCLSAAIYGLADDSLEADVAAALEDFAVSKPTILRVLLCAALTPSRLRFEAFFLPPDPKQYIWTETPSCAMATTTHFYLHSARSKRSQRGASPLSPVYQISTGGNHVRHALSATVAMYEERQSFLLPFKSSATSCAVAPSILFLSSEASSVRYFKRARAKYPQVLSLMRSSS